MAGRDNRPIEVWEAALGRHVVLIEARTWYEARDVARLMLGGEPDTRPHIVANNPGPLLIWDWTWWMLEWLRDEPAPLL